MRLTSISRAANLCLARDLPAAGPGGIPLLRAGTRLTDRLVSSVTARGIHAVWVQDELSEGIEPIELLSEDVRAAAAAGVHRGLEVARTAFAEGRPLPHEVLDDLAGIVDVIAASIADSPEAALAVSDQAAADEYTHRHAVNVTAIGILLARTMFRRDGWVDFRGRRRGDGIERRMTLLGVGLILHDVGKLAVPADIVNKPGPLDPGEWAIMRTHPEAGVALLSSGTISPLIKSVVHDHHERWDGDGYPRGLAGTRISQFARIAAVADVYDAVTSERPYKRAAPAHVGSRIITAGSGGAFDPEVAAAFARVVAPYPVGTELTLPDGGLGVVCAVDPERPHVPRVRRPAPGGYTEVTIDMLTVAGAGAEPDV